MNTLQVPLSHPSYTKSVKLRSWNCRTSALHCSDPKVAAQLIARFGPVRTAREHFSIAQYHVARYHKMKAIWSLVAERAAMEALNRPWKIEDYKICAIGREEFSEAHKRVLRHCAYRSTEHLQIARAHAILAKLAIKREHHLPGMVVLY